MLAEKVRVSAGRVPGSGQGQICFSHGEPGLQLFRAGRAAAAAAKRSKLIREEGEGNLHYGSLVRML